MRTTRKPTLLLAGIAVAALIGLFLYQLLGPSGAIVVSPQTTVITAPLADDGLPDYAAYLLDQMGRGVPPESNGAIPYLQAMWPAEIAPADQPVICKELGMALPAAEGMSEPYSDEALVDELVQWQLAQLKADGTIQDDEPFDDERLRSWVREEVIERCKETPWTADQAPPLADWVGAHESHYALLHEAASREHYYLPPVTLLTDPDAPLYYVLLPHVQNLRSGVRCLRLRVSYYLGTGDLDAAWQDILVMYRLSETCRGQALVGDLVSIACAGIANDSTKRLLNSDDLTPELAKQIHAWLQRRAPRSDMANTMDQFERLGFVTAVLEMAGARMATESDYSVTDDMGPLAQFSRLALNWNLMLEIGNEWYDRLVEAMSQPTYHQRHAALAAIDSDLDQLNNVTVGKMGSALVSRDSRTRSVSDVMLSLFLPATTAAIAAEERDNTYLLLHQVAAALAVYRVEQGDYPDDLTALTPNLLKQSLVDLYGNALAYRKTEGGYLLYSLGPNGVDEGGSHDQWHTYKGYIISEVEEHDRAIRKLVGEPPKAGDAEEPEQQAVGERDAVDAEPNPLDDDEELFDLAEEDFYEYLEPPVDADDVSIRLPLYHPPKPKFDPDAVDEW